MNKQVDWLRIVESSLFGVCSILPSNRGRFLLLLIVDLDLLSQCLFQVEVQPARYIIARRIFNNTELVQG